MKSYLYCLLLILVAAVLSTVISPLADYLQDILTTSQVPVNNLQVAGVQKYNIPPSSQGLQPPSFSAKAVLIKDLNTDTILFQKNADSALPIASTTKIMTALVANQYFKPNSPLTVKEGNAVAGSRVGVVAGETLSFRSLLYGMLLNSGNDTAFTIAENYPGGVLGFVSAMNKKASDLSLKNTRFDNPAGFDSPKHFSSAADLARITEEALKNDQLSRIFATKETQVSSLDKKYTYQLHNLNKLLTQVSGVLGVKTGYTEKAKENLVTLVDRGGQRILVVVLGSDDRFGESTRLIEWTYGNFTWIDQ